LKLVHQSGMKKLLLPIIFVLFHFPCFAQKSSHKSETENKLIAVAAPQPAYPAKAIVGKAKGDVLVDVKIDSTGKVVETTFVNGNELLKKPVLDSALKWKFNATKNENKYRFARLKFTFYLNKGL